MKQELLDFANGTLEEAKQTVKCGFEFEFHELNGKSGSSGDSCNSCGSDDCNVDHAQLCEDSYTAWSNLDMSDRFSDHDTLGAVIIALNAAGYSYSDVISNTKLQNQLENYYERHECEFREQFENDNWNSSEYRIERVNYSRMIKLPNYVEVGSDSSVRGGEIRTVGPRTVTEFLDAAKIVSQGDFKVDHGCSFHIHLSIPGVKHVYGAHLQADIYAYLISQWSRLPEEVKDRLSHDNGGLRWARFKLTNENKYVAVYKHGQNSWEFRLFGAITKFEDMQTCLDLAIEALHHAYRVKAGLEKSINGRANLTAINTTLMFCGDIKRLDLYHIALRRFDDIYTVVSAGLPAAQTSQLIKSLNMDNVPVMQTVVGA